MFFVLLLVFVGDFVVSFFCLGGGGGVDGGSFCLYVFLIIVVGFQFNSIQLGFNVHIQRKVL